MEFCRKSEDTNSKSTVLKFSSTLQTYLCLLGYSIGLSDIWRFPFLVYRNGGGAFIIPFVLTLGICGIPLFCLEYSLGKFAGTSVYGTFSISPLFRGVAVSIMIAYPLYFMGSTVFRCWLFEFMLNAFQDPLPWTNCNNEWNTKRCLDNQLTNMPNNKSNITFAHSLTNSNATGDMIDPIIANQSYRFDTDVANATGKGMTATEEFWQLIHCWLNAVYDVQTSLALFCLSFPLSRTLKVWSRRLDASSISYAAAGQRPLITLSKYRYKVLELSSGIADLHPVQWRYILMIFIFRLIIFFCIIKSVKSFEKVVFVTTLVPILLTATIFIRSLMLPGASNGLYPFFLPDISKLANPKIWIEAALMAFYTLGFGWGPIMTLGSHAQFRENPIRTCVLLTFMDTSFAIFSGMVCFSVLGNMAHAHGIGITEVINAGMSTGIVAYMTALSTLPLPQLWSALFILSTFLNALDGQMIPFDGIVQMACEMFPRLLPKYRIHTLAVLSCIVFIGSIPSCTGAGAYIFLFIDWYSAGWIGPIVTIIEMAVVAWIYGLDRFSSDIAMMIGKPLPAIMRILIAFITPAVVTALLLTSCVEYVPPTYGSYSYPLWARWLGWVSVVIVLLPILGHMVKLLTRDKGQLLQRLKRGVKPLDRWEPCEDSEKVKFHQCKHKYRNRPMKDLLHYNIFGKYPTNSYFSTMKQEEEMTFLGKA